jgi:c-di-GMP-binding flagellar brake protein YcgR
MTSNSDDQTQDFSPYQVNSRRQIVSLLRSVGERNQLVRMHANNGADSAVTSILDVDDAEGMVIIDCAPTAITNQRILDSDRISFETLLDNIRILFTGSRAESCEYEDRPALRIPIPETLIRLQRREYYRVPTPVINPVRCSIPVPDESGKIVTTVALSLYNVSAGGLAAVDEKKLIDSGLGAVFENCRVDLPGGQVVLTLSLVNSQEVTLASGKSIRRLGFMFVDAPNAIVAAIQRYITKLEREQNARATGLT